MTDKKSVNVWVSSEIGILKGVNLVGKTATNFFDPQKVGKENEIISSCWTDEKQTNIYTGFKHGFVREYGLETGEFGAPILIPEFRKGEENLVKVFTKDDAIFTGTSKGRMTLMKSLKNGKLEILSDVNAGSGIYDTALSNDKTKFATGGKENPLKVYDFEKEEVIFRAKNVPHDWLQLRVPIWVTGIQFLDNSESKIVTSTGTSKIRLYDIKTEQRRPCFEMNFDEYPLTSLSLTHNSNQVIVGNTRGSVGMFDFRKKGLVRVYKGFAGSVRHIQRHPTLDYIGSCGLDRFLRIHNIKTGKMEYKVYLKARLNSLMFSNLDFIADAKKLAEAENEENEARKRKLEDDEGDVDDPVWRKMKMVDEEGSSEEDSNDEDYD